MMRRVRDPVNIVLESLLMLNQTQLGSLCVKDKLLHKLLIPHKSLFKGLIDVGVSAIVCERVSQERKHIETVATVR